MALTKQLENKKTAAIAYSVLLYYSAILSIFLFLGGIVVAQSKNEIISNIIFLPVPIFLWLVLIQKRKLAQKIKKDSSLISNKNVSSDLKK